MSCIRPAGRRGACSCGNQYAQILDRLDTVEQEASDAKTTAQTAANSASIQAANAAADAAQAASDAGDALTQATAAAASAAAAALDAGNAAADLASINSTISSTLTAYLGTKVDKLTTTGSFAYTHTNATQGETALVDGTTSNTIPIRDANGRMQAADPASGATDKTLTTANWVSQTGANRPNNLIHSTGNEPIDGIKPMLKGAYAGLHESGSNNQGGWRKMFVSPSFAMNNEYNIASFTLTSTAGNYGLFTLIARNGSLTSIVRRTGNYTLSNVKASIDSSGEVIIWAYMYRTVAVLETENHSGNFTVTFTDSGTTSRFNEPVTPDYDQVITATE